jgi:NAD dependent epimerase/dehydratase family enzyme
MQCLVTGGTGFIGKALCQRLAAAGAGLTVLSRDRANATRLLPPGTRCIASLAELGPQDAFDAVINLAGEPIAAAELFRDDDPTLERALARVQSTLQRIVDAR